MRKVQLISEVKVGVVAAVAIVLLVWIILALGKVRLKDEGYEVIVIFPQIVGLREKDAVMLSGVRVGEVKEIYLRHDNRVQVILKIKPKVIVRKDALFIITTESMLGIDKFVAIVPQDSSAPPLKDKDEVVGQSPIEVREIIFGIKDTLDKTRTLSSSIDELLKDKELLSSVRETIININRASEQIADFTSILKDITLANKDELNTIVKDVKDTVKNLEDATLKVKKIAEGEEVKDILLTIRNTTHRLENITKKIDDDLTDKETISHIKGTLKNINQITNDLDKNISHLKKIRTTPSVEIATAKGGQKYEYQTNANLEIRTIQSPLFYLIGVQSVGDKNKLNLQVGKNIKEDITLRAGIKENKVSTGADYTRYELTTKVDFINPNEPRFDVSAYYKLKENLYLLWKLEDVENKKDNFWGIKFER